MLHFLKVATVVWMAALASMSVAQAGIPLPCTSDKIVKVASLPQNITTPDGKKVDLGYMFQWCFTGKWVGYIGSSSSYLNIPEALLLTAAADTKDKAIPLVPGFWASAWSDKWQFFVEWLWLCMLLTVAGGLISNKIFYGTFARPSSEPRAVPAAQSSTPVALRGFGKRA
jgi:hypothetical protein